MKKIIIMLLTLISITASAQNADKLYEQGKKFYDAKNYSSAFPMLKSAAEKGHKKAQYRLGRCYEKGNGTEENDQLAAQWYEKAAKQGYAKAQYQLGKCYKDGEGVPKDKKKAFELFMKAAQQEYGDAEYQVGKCYMKGKGVAADQAQAKKWLKRSFNNVKDGKKILDKLRKEASEGDEDSKAILTLTGKK